MNFSGLPGGADDRYFSDAEGTSLGRLDTQLDLADSRLLTLSDRWLGIDVSMEFDRPSGVWAFPIQTVSQSEGGFELVHQSVCVQPHWMVTSDADGRWAVNIELTAACERPVETVGEEQAIRL
jgi:alpha-amylase